MTLVDNLNCSGETSCILLPAVCKYNAAHQANIASQQKVATLLWSLPSVSSILTQKGLQEAEADLGGILDVLFRYMGMPRRLSDFGIKRDQFGQLAENSMHDRWVLTNPAKLDKEEVAKILKMVL